MEWDWIGNKDGSQGIATYCSRSSKIALALPNFEKGFALARLMDELRAESWDASREKIRANFQAMLDET